MLPRGLLKEYSRPLALMLRALDACTVLLAGWLAYLYRFGDYLPSSNYLAAFALSALLATAVFSFFGIYSSVRGQGFWGHIFSLIQALLLLTLVLAGIAFMTKTGDLFSRVWFMLWMSFSIVILLAFRFSLLVLLRLMRKRGWNERRVIVIGLGDLGGQLVETVQQALWTGFRIVTIFDGQPENKAQAICGIPVVKTPLNLSAYLLQQKEEIDELWLALPLRDEEAVKTILYELRHHTIAIRLVLDIFGLGLLKHSITQVDRFSMLDLNSSPMVGMNRIIKAFEDRALAAIILILISPVFLLVALAVKLSSSGPIFFKQLRHGWDGRIIKIYKFRTMILHQEQKDQVTQASSNDQRVTPLGRFLRRTSLDELPQFINVLQGRMSIVGPRPHALQHNEFYKDSINAYMQRHKVKPGITGWAQINGWRGETETLEKMKKRIEFDLYYIENWSPFFDLQIIFLTFLKGFVNRNAY